ncbi:MAG: hypothetical protein BRD34_02985 [Bacteroidetes bacterium QH_6_64_77]|nr:MAG: hypothetical protein BRD34_02985 [Bacteroidetes bacterium QH_6_64_77]
MQEKECGVEKRDMDIVAHIRHEAPKQRTHCKPGLRSISCVNCFSASGVEKELLIATSRDDPPDVGPVEDEESSAQVLQVAPETPPVA